MQYNKWRIWLCLFISIIFFECKGPRKPIPADHIAPADADTTVVSSYPFVASPSLNDNDDDQDADTASPAEIDDGSYTATVDYYNPNTNYSATYTLSVEVSDGKVIQINFPNDGYLDDDHISPAQIDENGDANVAGEDGKTYKIHINF